MNKKIEIGVILPGLGRVQRGAETAFLEVAKSLQAYPDMQVQLFGNGDNVPPELSIETIPCRLRSSFERWPKIPVFRSECHYEEYSFTRNLKHSRTFDAANFDAVIHCTYPFVNWFVQKQQRKNPELKSIFVAQNGDWMCRARHREYRYFKCDGLVTINPEQYKNNCKLHRTVLIPNGTDPAKFSPTEVDAQQNKQLRESFGLDIPNDKKVVLMVSALIDSKRVESGIRAASQVENAFLLIAGDGPLRDKLSTLAQELIPGRFKFLGSIDSGRMPELFRAADLFLHMSKTEPFGIVYLEAAASGLPIVSHDSATARWILGDTAIFADSDHTNLVADAIQEALESQTNEILGESARNRVVADWTWQAQGEKYREFILNLLDIENKMKGTSDALHSDRQLQHM